MKPKFHMMAEIALERDNPSCNWTHRDEEAGGTMARIAYAKGGSITSFGADFCKSFARSFQCQCLCNPTFLDNALHRKKVASSAACCVPHWNCMLVYILGGLCLVLRYRATWEGGRMWPIVVN